MNRAGCALAAHKPAPAGPTLSHVEGPRHEPGQVQRPDALAGLDHAPSTAVDPRNPTLETAQDVRNAVGAAWVELSDEERAAFVAEHGRRIRRLKDQGQCPAPVLPETWKRRR